jgi:hypothetical protein
LLDLLDALKTADGGDLMRRQGQEAADQHPTDRYGIASNLAKSYAKGYTTPRDPTSERNMSAPRMTRNCSDHCG